MTASASIQIDDLGPLPVVRPTTVPDFGDLVRRAATEGRALYPLGGRTVAHHRAAALVAELRHLRTESSGQPR